MLKGITVSLYVQTAGSADELNRATYTESAVSVENVLVAPSSAEEIDETLNLTGRRAVYTLGIPKGDTHNWTNAKVAFFGQEWRVIEIPTEGIESLIPLSWNKKVRVERIG